VDHQLAGRAAELAEDVFAYFEDYPYAAQEAAVRQFAERTGGGRLAERLWRAG
jgi:hypothetical protein